MMTFVVDLTVGLFSLQEATCKDNCSDKSQHFRDFSKVLFESPTISARAANETAGRV